MNLPEGVVHVWRASLEAAAGLVPSPAELLSNGERDRAERFRFDYLRERYVMSHAVLRVLLGRYLDAAPEEIVFVHSDRGKPRLAPECTGAGIGFSMSDSETMALYAFARAGEVGVDVEAERPLDDMHSLARTAFTAGECDRLRSLPAETQAAAFFRGWSLKEAVLKATGEGIHGLLRVECLVDVRRDRPVFGVREVRDARADSWTVHLLDSGPGYAGAVALPGEGWRCETFTFGGDDAGAGAGDVRE